MTKKLILPLIGIGNIGQYACQKLVDEGYVSKETIDTNYLYPFSSKPMAIAELKGDSPPVASKELVKPLQLYNLDPNTDVLQFYSPIITGCEVQLFRQISKIIKEKDYDKIVLIDSTDRGLAGDISKDTDFYVEREWGIGLAGLNINDSNCYTGTYSSDDNVLTRAELLLRRCLEEAKVENIHFGYCNSFVYEGENWMFTDMSSNFAKKF